MPEVKYGGRGTFCGLKNRRKCGRCGKVKHYSQFHKNKCKKDGVGAYCAVCRAEMYREQIAKGIDYGKRQHYYDTSRWVELKKRYGIDRKTYERMEKLQKGKCAICGKTNGVGHKGTPRRLAVDHDHTTGTVRALLCTDCNRGIGSFQDNPVLLKKALEYLLRHKRA